MVLVVPGATGVWGGLLELGQGVVECLDEGVTEWVLDGVVE